MSRLQIISTIICLVIFCQHSQYAQSFTVYPKQIRASVSSGYTHNTELYAIEVPSLDELDDNHEKEASRLRKSIVGWLDREWIPQEVHEQMADCVEKTFVKARNDGETEIMNVMTLVVDDLVENWKEYDKDSFVNAWDIGNYVSDYLHLRLDPSGDCGCSANIFNPDE